MRSHQKALHLLAATAVVGPSRSPRSPGRRAGAPVDPLGHVQHGLVWLHGRQRDGAGPRARHRRRGGRHRAALPSTTAAMKAAMDGEAEVGYTADVGMRGLYDQGTGFEGYEPPIGRLVHTWYAYPMESFMAVAADADDSSAAGRLLGRAGVLHPRRLHELAQLPPHLRGARLPSSTMSRSTPSTQADALQAGSIDGAVAYTTAGRSLASLLARDRTARRRDGDQPLRGRDRDPHRRRPDAAGDRPDHRLQPGCGRRDGLRRADLLRLQRARRHGRRFRLHMLSAFYEARDELAEPTRASCRWPTTSSAPRWRDRANPDIPVHAGLARFLEEHDAWNDAWTIAE
jgi:uncharacterized protein